MFRLPLTGTNVGRIALALCCAFVCRAEAASVPSATPADPPEVAALRAKIAAATGKRPPRERVRSTIREFGREVSVTTIRDGENERTNFGDGPLSSAQGTFEGQDWHQNANGLTVVDEARPGREPFERSVPRVERVAAPVVADVIVDVDAKGDGSRTFVDPATSHVVREEKMTRTGTSVTTYDDFRTTDGFTRAWHEHTVDTAAGEESDTRITSVETSGIVPADVAMAQPRRALVEFPKGTPQVVLPVMLDSDHKFIVHVMFGTRGADFILDSGSSGIAVDADFAKSLGLSVVDEGMNAGAAGAFHQGTVVIPNMDVGALKMRDVAAFTTSSLAFANRDAPVRIVGLLGFDFIASLALKLDYEHATVTATHYDAFVAPAPGEAIPVPLRLGDQEPETDVAVDGQVGESFLLDTGGSGGVLINDLFARRHPGVTRGFLGGRPLRLVGVGGETTATEYEVPKIRIGSAVFSNFSAIVVDSDRAYAGFDGIIGPDILQLFTVTTDFADSMIYLQKNDAGRRAAAAAR